MGDAMCEHARLAGAGSGHDDQWPVRFGSASLVRIERGEDAGPAGGHRRRRRDWLLRLCGFWRDLVLDACATAQRSLEQQITSSEAIEFAFFEHTDHAVFAVIAGLPNHG